MWRRRGLEAWRGETWRTLEERREWLSRAASKAEAEEAEPAALAGGGEEEEEPS